MEKFASLDVDQAWRFRRFAADVFFSCLELVFSADLRIYNGARNLWYYQSLAVWFVYLFNFILEKKQINVAMVQKS